MKRNSRLSLALHTLGHMASDPTQKRTSTDIADHSSTNPVVVRRVLGRLKDAGLLTSEKGHAGGWQLARSPDTISLADIYLALDESLIASSDETHTSNCSVEHELHRRVKAVLADAEQALIRQLSETSILDVRGP